MVPAGQTWAGAGQGGRKEKNGKRGNAIYSIVPLGERVHVSGGNVTVSCDVTFLCYYFTER